MQEEIERLLMEVQRSRLSERRTEPRQPFARPVTIHLPRTTPRRAFSKDLSTQGIGIVTEAAIPTGTLATLEIHSTTGSPVFVRSEVRWCDAFGKGWFLIGWKFIAIASPVY